MQKFRQQNNLCTRSGVTKVQATIRKFQKRTIMKIKILLPLMLLSFLSIELSAQFNPARRALERAANKASDVMVDKASKEMEQVLEEETQTERDTFNAQAGRAIDNITKDVEVREAYDFSLTLHLEGHTTTKRGKEKDPYKMNWLMAQNASYQGMESFDDKDQASFIIYDFENNGMLLFQEDKQVLAVSMEAASKMVDKTIQDAETNAANNDVKVQATGKKRTIAGYSCEQYVFTSNDTEGEVWITRDLDYDPMALFATMGQERGWKSPWNNEMGKGVALETQSTDLESGDTHFMTTTKVDKSARNYNMSNYKVMSMGDMMRGN